MGSRDDVAPCTGLGKALQSAGHHVAVAGYQMFGSLDSTSTSAGPAPEHAAAPARDTSRAASESM